MTGEHCHCRYWWHLWHVWKPCQNGYWLGAFCKRCYRTAVRR